MTRRDVILKTLESCQQIWPEEAAARIDAALAEWERNREPTPAEIEAAFLAFRAARDFTSRSGKPVLLLKN